jgi:hypothetical protein
VAPSFPHKIAKKIKCALQNAQIDGEVDLNTLDNELAGFLFNDRDNDDGEDKDDTTDLDAGNSLGKALVCPKDCRAHTLSDMGITPSMHFLQIFMCTSQDPYFGASSLDSNLLGFALPVP